MNESQRSSGHSPANEPLSDSSRSLVRKVLAEILESSPIRTSRQCQDLLTYIVEKSLSGEEESLRERVIGVEVFGRRSDYDTADDPVVRIRAAEIRKRLAQYYQTTREEQKIVRIEIPPGSYRAAFEWLDPKSATLPAQLDPRSDVRPPIEAVPPLIPHPVPAVKPPQSTGQSRSLRWAILAAVCILSAWAGLHFFASAEDRAFNQFWSPVLDNSNTVLIYIGSNAVYEFTPAYIEDYRRQHPLSKEEQMGLQFYVPLSPGTKINAEDLYASKDTFVTIGDVAATTKIVSLLGHRNKNFDIRFGNDVAYGDLRQNPTVLIGAYNNFWTIAMTDNLRYVFASNQAIQDRTDPKRRWSTNRESTEDYAIVSRILNSKSGATIITAAGISHTGTRAAAEFITSPGALATLAKSLPKGWEKKNIQVVLHTNVINQIPSVPDVVVTYSW